MKLVAKIDCKVNDKFYAKGDEIEVDNKEAVIKLNKLGFIEPLTAIEIQNWTKEPIKKNLGKKED